MYIWARDDDDDDDDARNRACFFRALECWPRWRVVSTRYFLLIVMQWPLKNCTIVLCVIILQVLKASRLTQTSHRYPDQSQSHWRTIPCNRHQAFAIVFMSGHISILLACTMMIHGLVILIPLALLCPSLKSSHLLKSHLVSLDSNIRQSASKYWSI